MPVHVLKEARFDGGYRPSEDVAAALNLKAPEYRTSIHDVEFAVDDGDRVVVVCVMTGGLRMSTTLDLVAPWRDNNTADLREEYEAYEHALVALGFPNSVSADDVDDGVDDDVFSEFFPHRTLESIVRGALMKKVAVYRAPSKIPGAGTGLWAKRPIRKHARVLRFQPGPETSR